MFKIKTIAHVNHDTRAPVLLLTNRDGNTYFFGKMPEGIQRVLNENKAKFGKMKAVFMTGTVTSWDDVGGLPGFLLTLSDATKKGISIFTGCAGALHYVIANWRYFVFRKGIDLDVVDVAQQKQQVLGDNNITVRSVVIYPGEQPAAPSSATKTALSKLAKVAATMFPRDTLEVNLRDPELYKTDPTDKHGHTHVKLPLPAEAVPHDQPSTLYVIRLLPMRGRFDIQRARAAGITPGPAFKKLERGEPIENDKGELVYPEQVMTQPLTFPRALVIDVPTPEYVGPTIALEEWFDHPFDGEPVGVVYHFLGPAVDFSSPEYTAFMAKFPQDTQHIISHPSLSNQTLVFKNSAFNVLKLRHMLKQNLNLPYIEAFEPLEGPVAKLQLLQTVSINSDGVSIDHTDVVDSRWDHVYDECMGDALPADAEDKSNVIDPTPIPLSRTNEATSLKDHVQVVTLGTGSLLPSLHRNVILTLVRVPQLVDGALRYQLVMLDGGENTLGTMLRNYGHAGGAQLDQVLKELRSIHLSHLHADHHIGLVLVICRWFAVNQNQEKLYLVLPWQFDHFLREWFALNEELGVDFDRIVYLSCEEFLTESRQPEVIQLDVDELQSNGTRAPKAPLAPLSRDKINAMYADLGIQEIQTVRAIHCSWAYLIAITYKLDADTTFKVSYSGDTRPNPKFATIGSKSDLLVHELSLDNDLIEEAIAKKHSTMIEAVAMAQLMDCPKLMLTHFSTRYSSVGNMACSVEELTKLAVELNQYLIEHRQSNVVNIFKLFDHFIPIRPVSDIDICFAFDTFTVWLDEMNCQAGKFNQIMDVLQGDDKLDAEALLKEEQKRKEKRDAKRDERLKRRKKSA